MLLLSVILKCSARTKEFCFVLFLYINLKCEFTLNIKLGEKVMLLCGSSSILGFYFQKKPQGQEFFCLFVFFYSGLWNLIN